MSPEHDFTHIINTCIDSLSGTTSSGNRYCVSNYTQRHLCGILSTSTSKWQSTCQRWCLHHLAKSISCRLCLEMLGGKQVSARCCLVKHVNCYAEHELHSSHKWKHCSHVPFSQPRPICRRKHLSVPSKHISQVRSAFSNYLVIHIITFSIYLFSPWICIQHWRGLIHYTN